LASTDRHDQPAAQSQEWLRDLRGYIRAAIGDADGQRAVERNRMLTLTAGQVQCLAEGLALLDAAIGGDDAE
jgi:hypothetical protein